jgi:hypothetical protein
MSLRAQAGFLRGLRVRIIALLVAAVCGVVVIDLEGVHVSGVLEFLAFSTALTATLFTSIRRPDKDWYEGRAAAESVKTLVWRYMVRGESFDIGDGEASALLLVEIDAVTTDLAAIEVVPEDGTESITGPMRSARALDYEAHRRLYRESRYAAKAEWNKKRAKFWSSTTIATAWLQAKQHDNLATAYSLTALELSGVLSELDGIESEVQWAPFVGQAEEAISREHTLWRASRGIRIKPKKPRN